MLNADGKLEDIIGGSVRGHPLASNLYGLPNVAMTLDLAHFTFIVVPVR